MDLIGKAKGETTVKFRNEEYRMVAGILLSIVTGTNQLDERGWEELATEVGAEQEDIVAFCEEIHAQFPLED